MLITRRQILNSLPVRLAALAGVISSLVWVFCWGSAVTGYSAVMWDGATTIAAGTTPHLILVALLFAGFDWLLLSRKAETGQLRVPSMWIRVAAFVIDAWFALFTLAGLFGVVPLLVEGVRTGVFQWHFERHYAVTSDAAEILLVMVFLVVFVAYFVLPLMRGNQTIGCWIFRLATINSDGYVVRLTPGAAIRRTMAEFRGVCSPIKTFRTRDELGRTFYDRDSGMTVARFADNVTRDE